MNEILKPIKMNERLFGLMQTCLTYLIWGVLVLGTVPQSFGSDPETLDNFQHAYLDFVSGSAKQGKTAIAWSPSLNRPVVGIRWGVAVEDQSPERGNNNRYAIGSIQMLSADGGYRGDGRSWSQLAKDMEFNGKVGTAMIGLGYTTGGIREMHRDTNEAYARMKADAQRREMEQFIARVKGDYKAVYPETDAYRIAGEFGDRLVSRLDQLIQEGKFGLQTHAIDMTSRPLGNICQLETGSRETILAAAKRLPLDVLLMISSKQTTLANGLVENETTVAFFDSQTGQQLRSDSGEFYKISLTNIEVEQMRIKNTVRLQKMEASKSSGRKPTDPVEMRVQGVGLRIVKMLIAPVERQSPEKADAATKMSYRNRPERTLQNLCEAYYHCKLGSLSNQRFGAIIDAYLGKNLAERLAGAGSVERKKLILDSLTSLPDE